MNSVELIRKLSEQGASDMSDALVWINPIPKDASDVIAKIDIAIKRLAYVQDRQGSTEKENTSEQRIVLSRLKTEVQQLLE